MARRISDIKRPGGPAQKAPLQKRAGVSSAKKPSQSKRPLRAKKQPTQRVAQSGFSNKPPRRPRHLEVTSDGERPLGKWLLWLIAFLTVVAAAGLVLSLFGGATLDITPKQEKTLVDGTFIAHAASSAEQTEGGEDAASLEYQLVSLSDTKAKEVPARDTKHVEEKASGTIVIYNAFQSAPQRLVKNTRFRAPNGNIYRIKDSITVPGTTVNEGKTIPGSIEATMYADQPGEEYNQELVDFTVPGFKGLPQYEHFYARSKTPISGGFSGERPVPAEEDTEDARQEIAEELRASLAKKVRAQTPDSFVVYDGGIFVSFDEPKVESAGEEGAARVSLTGTLQAVLFEKEALASFIAEQATARYDGHPVRIINIEDLPLTVVYEADDIVEAKTISFTLESNVHITWNVAFDELRERLAGEPKEEFQKMLSEFPGVGRAKASVRPFWKGDFPENAEEIKIKERIE